MAQWTRPGLPLPVSTTVATGANATTVPSEPSPTSVTEVPATEDNGATGSGGVSNTSGDQPMAVNEPSTGVLTTKRMPFGNMSNAGGIANANTNVISLKGKPTGILKVGTNVIQTANFNKPATNQETGTENVSQQCV